MKRVTIAVLDDGINDNMYVNENGLDLFDINKLEKVINQKEIKHGSRVVATIEKYCNIEKRYRIYDIFKSQNVLKNIIDILNELLKCPVDIIVMSFTIINDKYDREIMNLCERLTDIGTVIVAADSKTTPGNAVPACYNKVIGVGGILGNSNTLYWSNNERIQIRANILPEFVKIGDEYNLFSGTSKANAIVVAEVCKLMMNGISGYNEILYELQKRCVCNENVDFQSPMYCSNMDLNSQIVKILSGNNSLELEKNINIADMSEGLEEFSMNILKIDKTIPIPFLETTFGYYNFCDSYSLVNYLENCKNEKKNYNSITND